VSLHKKLRRDSGGQAVVETALVLPLLLLLLMGIIEFGRLGNAYLAVTHAARHGVRHAAVGASNSDIVAQVHAATTHLARENITVEVTPVPTQRRSGQDITVTVTYPLRLYLPFANLVFTANPVVVRSSLTMRAE